MAVEWDGAGVFPAAWSWSLATDGGKQLLTGPRGHLPKPRDENVATRKVKKVWAVKPEHPYPCLEAMALLGHILISGEE